MQPFSLPDKERATNYSVIKNKVSVNPVNCWVGVTGTSVMIIIVIKALKAIIVKIQLQLKSIIYTLQNTRTVELNRLGFQTVLIIFV